MREYTCKEALDAGFEVAYRNYDIGTPNSIKELDPDNVSGKNYKLYKTSLYKPTLTKDNFRDNHELLDTFNDYLLKAPDEVWAKAIAPIQEWLDNNPMQENTCVGILINRRL